MKLKATIYCLMFAAMGYGQTYEQLMNYSVYYNKDIDTFGDFIKIEPSVNLSNFGIQQIVYELDNHNIGIEEHRSNNGLIGEIYVFQTNGDIINASSQWDRCFRLLNNDQSLKFVKGIFEDNNKKENNLTYDEFLLLLNSKTNNPNISYGVRYTKNNAYYSLFVIKGKLVFTVDDKNF